MDLPGRENILWVECMQGRRRVRLDQVGRGGDGTEGGNGGD